MRGIVDSTSARSLSVTSTATIPVMGTVREDALIEQMRVSQSELKLIDDNDVDAGLFWKVDLCRDNC